jgi:hypothetical protein
MKVSLLKKDLNMCALYKKIVTQQDIHRFFLKTAIIIAAFYVTTSLSSFSSYLSPSVSAYEMKVVAEAEVKYYEKKVTTGTDDALKLEIAKAKLNAANHKNLTVNKLFELIEALKDLCVNLFYFFGALGLMFWGLYTIELKEPK